MADIKTIRVEGVQHHIVDANAIHSLEDAALTGAPTSTTPDISDNSTRIATTAFVQAVASGGTALTKVVYGATDSDTTHLVADLINRSTTTEAPAQFYLQYERDEQLHISLAALQTIEENEGLITFDTGSTTVSVTLVEEPQSITWGELVFSSSEGPTDLELVDLFNELGYYTSYMDETNTTFADAGNNYYI